ncbi:hypothetical protein Rxyl_1882 [Rubrobacter xylanophilus DSM 9941]|uniref:Uncharacterized protein n=1 Tax=Rubrobacter xylanophilus (strain DSM 9941 / JCM 11954 / NBRC 16129 / PRD-1) TaxID=266117 RepID=Q1AUU6_RUBXD|nr:hypothetical protein Rxyl_1882 [Rubrobacter xylanophilus DSM 9941]
MKPPRRRIGTIFRTRPPFMGQLRCGSSLMVFGIMSYYTDVLGTIVVILDEFPDPLILFWVAMCSEVIHHHNLPRTQARYEHLLYSQRVGPIPSKFILEESTVLFLPPGPWHRQRYSRSPLWVRRSRRWVRSEVCALRTRSRRQASLGPPPQPPSLASSPSRTRYAPWQLAAFFFHA